MENEVNIIEETPSVTFSGENEARTIDQVNDRLQREGIDPYAPVFSLYMPDKIDKEDADPSNCILVYEKSGKVITQERSIGETGKVSVTIRGLNP